MGRKLTKPIDSSMGKSESSGFGGFQRWKPIELGRVVIRVEVFGFSSPATFQSLSNNSTTFQSTPRHLPCLVNTPSSLPTNVCSLKRTSCSPLAGCSTARTPLLATTESTTTKPSVGRVQSGLQSCTRPTSPSRTGRSFPMLGRLVFRTFLGRILFGPGRSSPMDNSRGDAPMKVCLQFAARFVV